MQRGHFAITDSTIALDIWHNRQLVMELALLGVQPFELSKTKVRKWVELSMAPRSVGSSSGLTNR